MKGVVVAALLLAALPAQAAYFQEGADAARTGVIGGGPRTADVAYVIPYNGTVGPYAIPVLLDGRAYVALASEDAESIWLGDFDAVLLEIDLATGDSRVLAEHESAPLTFAGDGDRLFLLGQQEIVAFDLGGAMLWESQLPRLLAEASESSGLGRLRNICLSPAALDGRVYVACQQWSEATIYRATGAPTVRAEERLAVYAAAYDAATGERVWLWEKPASDEAQALVPGAPDLPDAGPSANTHQATTGISVVGDAVYVSTLDLAGRRTAGTSYVWALDRAAGTYRWAQTSDGLPVVETAPFRFFTETNLSGLNFPAVATGTPEVVFTRLLNVALALNPNQGGAVLWSAPLGAQDQTLGFNGNGLAYTGDSVYVTSAQTLYRLDPTTGEVVASRALPVERAERWSLGRLVVDDRHVFGRTHGLNLTTEAVYALDRDTLEIAWRHEFPRSGPNPFYERTPFGVSDGLLVAVSKGNVTVLGTTPASLRVAEPDLDPYPAPGEPVRLDLSETRPGKFGAATAWRVDWGDGTDTGWVASPRFEHAYAEAGDRTVTYTARNDAGQTSSGTAVVHVGGRAPTFLETAFSAENQERTFFALGLVATGAVGAFGVLRIRRRRSVLRAELDALDRARASARERPASFERALREARVRAQALLVGGRLDEAQYAVLRARIDDLARQTRLDEVEEKLRYLPFGMVQTLREILRDGEVTRFERDHFLAALEREDSLSAEQKARVRALVDGWFADDDRAQP